MNQSLILIASAYDYDTTEGCYCSDCQFNAYGDQLDEHLQQYTAQFGGIISACNSIITFEEDILAAYVDRLNSLFLHALQIWRGYPHFEVKRIRQKISSYCCNVPACNQCAVRMRTLVCCLAGGGKKIATVIALLENGGLAGESSLFQIGQGWCTGIKSGCRASDSHSRNSSRCCAAKVKLH